MNRRLFMPLLGSALMLVGCTKHVAWHQKLMITVATPSGDKAGSSVTGISATVGQQFASSNAWASTVTGEATVVEVAPGKYLFALLASDYKEFQNRIAVQFGDSLYASNASVLT